MYEFTQNTSKFKGIKISQWILENGKNIISEEEKHLKNVFQKNKAIKIKMYSQKQEWVGTHFRHK